MPLRCKVDAPVAHPLIEADLQYLTILKSHRQFTMVRDIARRIEHRQFYRPAQRSSKPLISEILKIRYAHPVMERPVTGAIFIFK